MEPQQHPLSPCSFYNIFNSNFDEQIEFSSSFSAVEEASDISSFPCFSAAELDQALLALEDFLLDEADFNGDQMEFESAKFSESEGSFFPSSNEGWSPTPSIKSNGGSNSLNLPGEEIEINTRLSVLHLLKAVGEAIENGQIELSDVIMKCVADKVSLVGEPLLRLAFNLCEDFESQHRDYLKQQSLNNFSDAFNAIYQIFPYGKFAHFASNSLILESIPADTETLHIVDFDMGEGVQWPPVLEAAARLRKSVKITAIRWENEVFNRTTRGLMEFARGCGLNLKVVEVEMEDLVSEIKRTMKRGGFNKEWLAFNCMVGLPHMGRARSRKLVEEFLRTAGELIEGSVNRSIIAYADGDGSETLRNCSGFGLFFEGKIGHYEAMLESMEYGFPGHLMEARMALEALFVRPFVSARGWLQSWMEMKQFGNPKRGRGVRCCGVSRESLAEAIEMVGGKENIYGVRVGGEMNNNEMILEWRGNALVRVCGWKK